MKEVYDFFCAASVCFLAVCAGSQPHLYPFESFFLHQGRLYFRTGRAEAVTRQLHLNPRLELCAVLEDGRVSVEGSAVLDNDRVVRSALLSGDDDAELWYLRNCTPTRFSLDEPPMSRRIV